MYSKTDPLHIRRKVALGKQKKLQSNLNVDIRMSLMNMADTMADTPSSSGIFCLVL